jgi:hypothetical protein
MVLAFDVGDQDRTVRLPLRQFVEREPPGDGEEPRAERGGRPIGMPRPPDAQEAPLGQVLGGIAVSASHSMQPREQEGTRLGGESASNGEGETLAAG